MSSLTFLKTTFLIILVGFLVYAVMPKYEVKNVTYQSLVMSNAPGFEDRSDQIKVLIRINVITGKVENFLSSITGINEKVVSHDGWSPLADEKKQNRWKAIAKQRPTTVDGDGFVSDTTQNK